MSIESPFPLAFIGLALGLALIVQAAGPWQARRTPAVRAQPPAPGTVHGPTKISLRDLPPVANEASGAPPQPRRVSQQSSAAGAGSGHPVPAPNVSAAGTASAPIISSSRFEGLDNSANVALGINLTPPDPQLAVGPDYVVEFVNVVGRVYGRSGQPVSLPFALASFFGAPVDHKAFDPRLAYDAQSGRWFASLVSYLDRTSGTDEGRLSFAVSAGSDPTGTWNVYSIIYDNVFPDQPAFGLTDDKFTVSSNVFDIDGGPVTAGCGPSDGYCGDEIIVVQKSDLLAGVDGPSVGVHFFPLDTNHFTERPAVSLSSTNDQYLTTFDFASDQLLDVIRITGTPADGNVMIADISSLAILAQDSPPPSTTLGSGSCIVGTTNLGPPPCIDSGDGRPLTVIWRAGRLWTSAAAACQPPSDTAARSCAHLIEVETAGTPSVTQDIMYGAASQYYSYPAVATDASNNLFVSLTHTNLTVFAEAAIAGRLFSDPPNTLSASTVLRTGNTAHNSGRWGDYLGAAVDPTAPSCVWVVGEYAKSVTGQDWATYIAAASFDDSCPNVPTPTPSSTLTPTQTRTPTGPTSTPTATPTPTDTPTPTATSTPTDTATPTITSTPTATLTPTATPTLARQFGDVSCDRSVNSIDATFVLQLSAGLLGALPCPQNGDVTRDGQTNALDAFLILQFSADLIHTLPPA